MFAVIKIGGTQHIVEEGDQLSVDYLRDTAVNSRITIPDVLLIADDGKIRIGMPWVEGASIDALIRSHVKKEKIFVEKFKSKVRYRRKKGFRPLKTDIEIQKISLSHKSKEIKTDKKGKTS